MIYTCTMNPSLDCYMEADQPLKRGTRNRSMLEYYEAGGKGINVSIVLNNLQVPSHACGFLGGFTKDFYITLLEKYSYIQPNFTYTKGHTRINVKYRDGKCETELNAAGPYITAEDMEHLMTKTNRLDEEDFFVLAGNCPRHLDESVLIMLERLMDDGVRVCLNTDWEIAGRAIPLGAFLVKTNIPYLEECCGTTFADEKSLFAKLKELQEQGVKNIICTDAAGEHAYMACSEGVYECDILHDKEAVSMIGTGDALVAGFIMNSLRSSDPVEAFRFGCCCSEATAFTKGFGTREKIMELYEQCEVTKAE